jgi:hypothetical protein
MPHPPADAPTEQAGDPTPETRLPEAGPLPDTIIRAVERELATDAPSVLPRPTEITAVGLPVTALSQLIRTVAATVPDAELPPAATPPLGAPTVARLSPVPESEPPDGGSGEAGSPTIPPDDAGLSAHHPFHLRALGSKWQVRGAVNRLSVSAAAPATLRAFTEYPPEGHPFGSGDSDPSHTPDGDSPASDKPLSGDGGRGLARFADPPVAQMKDSHGGTMLLPNIRIAPEGGESSAPVSVGEAGESAPPGEHRNDSGQWPPREVTQPPLVFAGREAFSVLPSPDGWWRAAPVAAGEQVRDLYGRYLSPWLRSEPVAIRTPPYHRLLTGASDGIGQEYAEAFHRALGLVTVSSRAVQARGRSGRPTPGDPPDSLKVAILVVLVGAFTGEQLKWITRTFDQLGFVSSGTLSRAKSTLMDQTDLIRVEDVPQDVGRPRHRLTLAPHVQGEPLEAVLDAATAALN